MTNTTPRKPPLIITRFATELSTIIADYLSNPELLNQRIPLTDRLAIKLMFTLNKNFYRRELLFRDYSKLNTDLLIEYVQPDGNTKELHTESIFYTQAILGRRLTIVAKQKSLPTNLHILLLMLCRYSVDNNWLTTRIKRRKKTPYADELFFKKTAKILNRQCKQLKTMSAVSTTYRKKYGAFHLSVGENSSELIEEISLFDLIEAVPKPLKTTIKQLPVWYRPLVENILSSLNGEYGLLRSCGLAPQDWLGELSIGNLRDLKKLKKITDNALKIGEQKELYFAYQQAFLEILGKKESKTPKVAGFKSFSGFSDSKIGMTLLKFLNNNIENQDFFESPSSTENDAVDLEMGLKTLLVDYADIFTPLTAYFFEQALILQRPLYGNDGMFNDTLFRNLVAQDKKYSGLEDKKLATKLSQKIQMIIEKHTDINHYL